MERKLRLEMSHEKLNNSSMSNESRRFFAYSALTIAVLTLVQCKFEYFMYPENVWSTSTGCITSVIYMFLGIATLRGYNWYHKMVPLMILTGVPIISERILWTTGMSGSASIWFAIMPMYTILFGPRHHLKWIVGYIIFGFFATYAIQEYYASYFHPLQDTFPNSVGMSMTIVAMTGLFLHVCLFEFARNDKDKKIEQQKAEIESGRRLAVVGELAGGVAHEINNPLATMRLVTDMLKENPEQWKNHAHMFKHLEMLSNVVDRIATTVKALLHFSLTKSNENLYAVRVEDIVQQSIDMASYKLKDQKIEVQIELNGFENELIHCRSVEIEQSINTLLVNACEAVENSSRKWIRIEYREDAANFIFEISNSGQRIPQEIAERMFEPYFTTKDFGKGMGLGLSVALGLINSHAGNLVHEPNRPNTTFAILLPKIGLSKLAAVHSLLAS